MLVLLLILALYVFVHRCVVGPSRIVETQSVIFRALVLVGEVVTLFLLGFLIFGLSVAVDMKYRFKESPSPHSQILPRPEDRPIRW